MGFSFPVGFRVKVIETMLDGVSTESVLTSEGVCQASVYRWMKWAGVRMRRNRPKDESLSVVFAAPQVGAIGAGAGHGRRLDLADRTLIQLGMESGVLPAQIAKMVGVNPSTIGRELAHHGLVQRIQNGPVQYQYSAKLAQYRTDLERARPKKRKLDTADHKVLRQTVVDKLNAGLSPAQVAVRLPVDFPDDGSMRISHEAIYQALYVQGAGSLREELKVEQALRSGRRTRKPRSKLPARVKRPWLAGVMLADRDEKTAAEHAGRAVPGHWEGDLVVGPENSGIITLVERASRFALLGRLPGTRDSATVIDRLQDMVRTLPQAVLASITWDQGNEMAQHARFTVATGCKVYFCDPHSPWQRPTNENFNGQLRWDYPKGTNFNDVTDAELRAVQDKLNSRPRVILKGYTPTEKLEELLTGIALTL
ncbi:IS30 family transposase [Citricoccus zhacaiensis]|uniref:IS30 family transposase n=2 Tax=Citricoccus zhacaiensis TaxID=489142 RepID=UPI003CD06A82